MLNQTQPQTLQIAVMLMYIDAVFLALFGGLFSIFGLVFIAAFVASGYGIANERKWGYYLGVGIAGLRLAFELLPVLGGGLFGGNMIGLLFAVAKVALLVHPMSREYQRIWFK
ncbi:MAG: hypothetical protein QOI98_1931 [Solirubrobacteraceae bacterium]|nr:hypothetical protein [Solirubrobacteraceae bacterium]